METPKTFDFKKEFKELYQPKNTPATIQVPPILYIMVDGTGSPSSQEYQQSVATLYTLSYAIKMSYKNNKEIAGFYMYGVAPLEGLWEAEGENFTQNRDSWRWTSMIRQPDFVTPEVFEWAKQAAAIKDPSLPVEKARLATYDEGLCVQMMHIGPYATEQQTIDELEKFTQANHYQNDCGPARRHHEIYLGDPRRSAPEKLKTVLRLPVKNLV